MRQRDVKYLQRFLQDYFDDPGPSSPVTKPARSFWRFFIPDPIVASAAKKFLFLLFLFSVTRIVFFCVHRSYFASLSPGDIASGFLWGIRFDISVVCWIHLAWWGLWISPLSLKFHPILRRLADIGFWAIGSIALLPNIADTKYFPFTLHRMTSDIFRQLKTLAGEDTSAFSAMLKDSYGLVLLWIFLSFLLFIFLKRCHWEEVLALARDRRERKIAHRWLRYSSFLFWVCLLVIGCRGGLGGRVLDPTCVVRLFNKPAAGVLIGNSTFSIMKSLGQKPLKSFHFFDNDEEIDSIYSPFHKGNQGSCFGLYKGKNIVVIILESFSAEHVGFLDKTFKTEPKSFTPFLDELSNHSLCFDGWANGSISIEALPSIFSSIPSLQEKPYVRSSSGISNHIEGLTSRLETMGYHASFFYGGKKYSCDFDCYWKKVGLKHYFCEESFPKITKEIYSGWGIHDLPFLNHVADALNRQPEPFVSGIFTLSAHHPFVMPKGFKNKFPKGKHPIQELVAYTDYALKCFWDKISQMLWYKNTLFVLVADHTSGAIEPYYQGPIGAFSIPILFFDPENRLPQEYSGQLAQQIDIMPTLLHLAGYSHPYVAFGRNLMDEKNERFAINLKDNIYQCITENYCLQFDGEAVIGFFDRKKDPEARKNLLGDPAYERLRQKYEKFFKAFLQQYSQALARDALVLEN